MATTHLTFLLRLPNLSTSPYQSKQPLTESLPVSTWTVLGLRNLSTTIRGLGTDLSGDFGAIDPFPVELESKFGKKVLGNVDTEHKILISNLAALSLAQQNCQPVSPLQPPMSEDDATKLLKKVTLKSCRETHCHFCLNELPVDKVPCTSCSIPFYCSLNCQLHAGGKLFSYPKSHGIQKTLSNNLGRYVTEITLGTYLETHSEHIPEHRHECQGVSWPLVLPSEIVLAGRAFVKSKMQRRDSVEIANLIEIWIVILISQIRVNSMAITLFKSIDVHGIVDQFGKFSSGALTSNVEQVKLGQAIYEAGSLFNHSCQPNIHAYFLSRTLVIRTTEIVAAGCPLELSYGLQVGQWDYKDRIKFLEDEYSFHCQCSGCSKANSSDLVLHAFHCVKPNCSGIVLDSGTLDREKHKTEQLPNVQVENFNKDDTNVPTLNAFLDSNSLSNVNPGYCLKCGSCRDLETSCASVNKAWKCIRRLQDGIVSEDISSSELSDALKSLDLLKSTLHAYNRKIAGASFCFLAASSLLDLFSTTQNL